MLRVLFNLFILPIRCSFLPLCAFVPRWFTERYEAVNRYRPRFDLVSWRLCGKMPLIGSGQAGPAPYK